MLTSKNKALLKKLANPLAISLTLGKGEVDPSVLSSVDKALTAHELIKVRVLTNSNTPREDVAKALSACTSSEVVEIIGRIIVLYRARKENPAIVLY